MKIAVLYALLGLQLVSVFVYEAAGFCLQFRRTWSCPGSERLEEIRYVGKCRHLKRSAIFISFQIKRPNQTL